MSKDQHIKELINILESSTYPATVRIGAADGLGFVSSQSAESSLLKVAKSSAYPAEVRAAAAKALGRTLSN